MYRRPGPNHTVKLMELGGQEVVAVDTHLLLVQPHGLTEVQSHDIELSKALALQLMKDS
ncbi:MAG TPA: hypothetical protein VK191_01295 [Symbiobacteriaceae bacterium]|nr:hypothetical protein [Symbiobacteriaceae bacterium]